MIPDVCPTCAYPNPNAKNYCMKCGAIFQQAEAKPLTSGRPLYGIDPADSRSAPSTVERAANYNPVVFFVLIGVGIMFLLGGASCGMMEAESGVTSKAKVKVGGRRGAKVSLVAAAAPLLSAGLGIFCIGGAFRYRRNADND